MSAYRSRGRGAPGGLGASALVALAVAALLAALSLVTWRQARAFEVLAELDSIQRERSMARAEVVELDRRIQQLEGRARVVREARRRLGMRIPSDREIVHLPGEQP